MAQGHISLSHAQVTLALSGFFDHKVSNTRGLGAPEYGGTVR
jgi:hypothetical protein